MSLSVISEEKKVIENEVQAEINHYIATNNSIVFDSGAGSGKTYALAESIKFTLRNSGQLLKDRGQKIVCITYTNVATEELRERLQYSDLVLISTIHERLWSLISKYQKPLVELHKEKIIEEINLLNEKIDSEGYQAYNSLSSEQQANFIALMNDYMETFYKIYNHSAREFRAGISPFIGDYNTLLSNVKKFKTLVTLLFRKEGYERCIEKIIESADGYTSVEYTARNNSDRLDRMQFSHDTLIEYANKLFKQHSRLCQIVFDLYPYIFVDEYQDTSPLVVEILSLLNKKAVEYGHPLFVGYFGDAAQNIYETGVGVHLREKHPCLKEVKKEYNRRSTSEVIDISNRIRNDHITQRSIYDDHQGGCVEFYIGGSNDIQKMIEKCKIDWESQGDHTFDCMLLTNRDVANYAGFKNLYKAIKNTPKYSTGRGYEQLNTELLSTDLTKLWYVQRSLFEIVNLYVLVRDDTTPITDVILKRSLADLNIEDLRQLISVLRDMDGENLKIYVQSIAEVYNNFQKPSYKGIIEAVFPDRDVSLESIRRTIREGLITNEVSSEKDLIDGILNIPMSEYMNWHGLLTSRETADVVFHTYHGTKGLEFDNALIIMGNRFGQTNDYISRFFIDYFNKDALVGEKKDKYIQTRNLLHVACSRAINNLRILYIDDISEFEKGVKAIFGSAIPFT